MRGLLAFLITATLLLAPQAHAGIRAHGQAVSSACTGAPVGVISLGLCSQLFLKSTNGTQTATVNVASYPATPGLSYNAGTQNTDLTGAGTAFSGIDNAGHGGFYFSGNGTWTMTNFTITSNAGVTGSGQPLTTGQTSGGGTTGATNVDIEHGTVDGVGMDFGRTTMVQAHGLGTFKIGYTNLLRPARDQFVSNDPGGTFIFDHVYNDAPCQNADPMDHCEPFHALTGGTYTWLNGYSNMSDGTDLAGNSGAWQLQSGQGSDFAGYTGGNLTATITGYIINYGCVLNQTTLSLKAVFADVTANFGSNAVCPPANGVNHVIVTQADIGITSVIGNFANNDTLTAAGGKSASLLCSPAPTCVSNLHLSTWGTGAHFAAGDVITGSPSGATAVATSAIFYHTATINDLGGSLNYDGTPYTP